VECFILYPLGRVSLIQEQQMTTVPDANIHCLRVDGTFDDCQDIVKASLISSHIYYIYFLLSISPSLLHYDMQSTPRALKN